MIEKGLGVDILLWPSVEDMVSGAKWKNFKFEGVWEVLQLIDKKRLFEDWCLEKHQGCHNILLDDLFGNTRLEHFDSNTIMETVDILTIKERFSTINFKGIKNEIQKEACCY